MKTNSTTFTSLNDLAEIVHQNAKDKGFYDQEETDSVFIARALMNLHAECSELWEAHRNGETDDYCDKAGKMVDMHLPALKCVEEELADILIRVLDTAARLNVNIGTAVWAKHTYNTSREYRHGGKVA